MGRHVLIALVAGAILLLSLSAASAQTAPQDNSLPLASLWEQSIQVTAPPEQLPDGIKTADGKFLIPRANSVMFAFAIAGIARIGEILDVSNADFSAVEPSGRRSYAMTIKLDDRDWLPPDDNGRVRALAQLDQGQPFTVSVAFCLDSEFDWPNTELRLAVPLQGITSGTEPEPDNVEHQIRLWDQAISIREDPSVVNELTMNDGRVIRPPEGSRMLVVDMQATAVSAGILQVSNIDFVVVAQEGNRIRASSIRCGPPILGWHAPPKDSTVRVEVLVERDEAIDIALAFCVPDDFQWQQAEFRILVPLDAIAKPDAGSTRVPSGRTHLGKLKPD